MFWCFRCKIQRHIFLDRVNSVAQTAELFARFSRRNLNILIKAQRTFICASLDSRERKEENLRELFFFSASRVTKVYSLHWYSFTKECCVRCTPQSSYTYISELHSYSCVYCKYSNVDYRISPIMYTKICPRLVSGSPRWSQAVPGSFRQTQAV
jgi:hypothetical protein